MTFPRSSRVAPDDSRPTEGEHRPETDTTQQDAELPSESVPAKKPIRTIGILIESSRGAGRDLLFGIGRFVRAHPEWSIFWAPGGFEAARHFLRNQRFDGVIVRDVVYDEKISKLGVPTVVFGHLETEVPEVLNVSTDSQEIGRLAAEHLLACGFRHFAYAGFPMETLPHGPRWSEDRKVVFIERIRQAGFSCADFESTLLEADRGRGPEALGPWLLSLPKPLGCMAANDDRASHVARACKLVGLRVPEDVGIIGVDNDELLCAFSDPALSSVAVSFERAGFEAAEALDTWMRTGKAPASSLVASVAFVAGRRSTDVVAVEDGNLAKALHYVKAHLREGRLSVANVAQEAGLSRRALERRFRSVMGRSIQDHIRHLRIGEITRAVVETEMPIVKIARSLGFEDVQHFSRYFRALQGMSPLEYRRSRQGGRTPLRQTGD